MAFGLLCHPSEVSEVLKGLPKVKLPELKIKQKWFVSLRSQALVMVKRIDCSDAFKNRDDAKLYLLGFLSFRAKVMNYRILQMQKKLAALNSMRRRLTTENDYKRMGLLK